MLTRYWGDTWATSQSPRGLPRLAVPTLCTCCAHAGSPSELQSQRPPVAPPVHRSGSQTQVGTAPEGWLHRQSRASRLRGLCRRVWSAAQGFIPRKSLSSEILSPEFSDPVTCGKDGKSHPQLQPRRHHAGRPPLPLLDTPLRPLRGPQTDGTAQRTGAHRRESQLTASSPKKSLEGVTNHPQFI